jgi:rod shape-determining protein MreC
MSMGTLERSAPSMFKQGPSALSQLVAYSALALFLMVADARFKWWSRCARWCPPCCIRCSGPWSSRSASSAGVTYFDDLETAQQEAQEARQAMLAMAQRATQPISCCRKTSSCASCWHCATA